MAIQLDGNTPHQILVSGFGGKPLRAATAFGTSMRPLIKPGAKLTLEPVSASRIQLGDIISFESRPGLSVTHRVVKIFKKRTQIFFITKGDNRLDCDRAIMEAQILGRVIRVGRHPLRFFKWRMLGWLVAQISYAQSVLYRRLAQSRLNQFRHWLEDKGACSRVALRPGFAAISSPMRWLTCLELGFDHYRLGQLRGRLGKQGITIESWSPEEIEPMTRVWNEAFPAYATTAERFKSMVFQGPWFDDSTFFLAKQKNHLLGWVLVRAVSQDSRVQWETKTGSLDVLALTEAGWRMRLDRILFLDSLVWLQKKGAKQIFLNSHPVPDTPVNGVSFTPLLATASAFGFEPTTSDFEWLVTPETYSRPPNPDLREGSLVREWRPSDDVAVRDFFKQCHRNDTGLFYDRKQPTPKEGTAILIAMVQEKVVGFCRLFLNEEALNCGAVTWMWIVSKPARRRGYFFRLLVDPEHRRQGIGTALAARAFKLLFESGCREIRLIVVQDAFKEQFYRRFGFQKVGHFLRLKRLEKN